MRITGRTIVGCGILSFGLALCGLGLSWTSFDPLAPVSVRGIDESERSRLTQRTGLWFPPASRFQLSRSVGGLQGGDITYKLRLTSEEVRRFVGQSGLVRFAPSPESDPMVDDPALPGWRPGAIREPEWRQSPSDGWREPKVVVLAEAGSTGLHEVYVCVSDPLG